jgi:hypothetical protein
MNVRELVEALSEQVGNDEVVVMTAGHDCEEPNQVEADPTRRCVNIYTEPRR